jgi:hypothetical protein
MQVIRVGLAEREAPPVIQHIAGIMALAGHAQAGVAELPAAALGEVGSADAACSNVLG